MMRFLPSVLFTFLVVYREVGAISLLDDESQWGQKYMRDFGKSSTWAGVGKQNEKIFNMVTQTVALTPPDLNNIRVNDRKLRKHIKKYMKKPLFLKLSTEGKFSKNPSSSSGSSDQMMNGDFDPDSTLEGYRLKTLAPPTRRPFSIRKSKITVADVQKRSLDGLWRENKTKGGESSSVGTSGMDFYDKASYEDALKKASRPELEFEIILPPMQGKKKKNVHVVFKCLMEKSTMDYRMMAPRTQAKVSIYPNGKTENEELSKYDEVISDAGTGFVNVVMKNGLVDSSWAMLRKPYFRQGRSGVGKL